jgi:propanediol utilization protein
LAEAIQFALKPNIQKTAQGLAAKIRAENGVEAGVESFHKHLHADTIRCMFSPSRCAVWRIKKTKIRLSAFAATTLSNEGILDLDDLRL